jgi:hypothetical protein
MLSAPRVFVWDDHPVIVSHGLPRPLHALRIERYIDVQQALTTMFDVIPKEEILQQISPTALASFRRT